MGRVDTRQYDRRIGSTALSVRVALVTASALVAVACSGGDDTVATTVPPATSSPTSVPSTEPSPSTTEPAPSIAPTTAPGTTQPTAVETTDPPPTTEPDLDKVEEAVLAAAVESWRVFNEARLDPMNDEKVAEISNVRTGELLERSIEIIGNYRFGNEREVTHPEFPARVEPYPQTVQVDLVSGTASVEYCRIGSNIWVETGGNPDGSDRIIDDTVNAYRERADLVSVGGVWLETGGAQLAKVEGSSTCPAG